MNAEQKCFIINLERRMKDFKAIFIRSIKAPDLLFHFIFAFKC